MAGASIGSAALTLSTDSSKLDAGLAASRSKIGGFFGSLSSVMKFGGDFATGNFGGIANQLTSALGATGPMGAAVATGVNIAKSVMSGIESWLGRAVGKIRTAQLFDIDIETFSAMGRATAKAGVDSDTLAASFHHLSGMVEKASDGNQKAIMPLSKLGLTFRDLEEIPVQERFLLVAERLSQIQDAGQRAAISNKLLGEGMARVAQHGDTLRESIDKAKASGVGIIKEKDAEAIELASIALKRLHNVSDVFFGSLATALAPAIESISNMFTGLVSSFRPLFEVIGAILDWAVSIFEPIFSVIVAGVKIFFAVLKPVFDFLKGIFSTVATVFREVANLITWFTDLVLSAFNDIAGGGMTQEQVWDAIKQGIKDTFEVIKAVIEMTVVPIIDSIKAIKKSWQDFGDSLRNSELGRALAEVQQRFEAIGIKFDSTKALIISGMRQLALMHAPLIDAANMVGNAWQKYFTIPLQEGMLAIMESLQRMIDMAAQVPVVGEAFKPLAGTGDRIISGQRTSLDKARESVARGVQSGDAARDINSWFDRLEDRFRKKQPGAPRAAAEVALEVKTPSADIAGSKQAIESILKAQSQELKLPGQQDQIAIQRRQLAAQEEIAANTRPNAPRGGVAAQPPVVVQGF